MYRTRGPSGQTASGLRRHRLQQYILYVEPNYSHYAHTYSRYVGSLRTILAREVLMSEVGVVPGHAVR